MLLRPLLDLFFPPLCHVCRRFIPEAEDLFICPDCTSRIRFLVSPLCDVCGAPFAAKGDDHTCGMCLTRPPRFRCRSAAVLDGPVQQLIHGFKYGGRVHLGHPLGVLTASALSDFRSEAAPDLILPVPLHKKRLRERGYNQSQMIASVLGKRWKVRLEVGNLRRARWTEPQTGLDAASRAKNVTGAFVVEDPKRLAGKRVMLVDDVLTTGSTMLACVDALLESGVASVAAVTVARGMQQ